MKSFSRLPVFEKELKRLLKKYRTLKGDLEIFEGILTVSPTGFGRNFTIIHSGEGIKIIKARIACRALRSQSLRIIYAYHEEKLKIEFVELYFKGDKESEDGKRIENYLK